MEKSDCEKIKILAKRYQEEIDKHKIESKYKQTPTKELEEYINGNNSIQLVAKKCNQLLTQEDCKSLKNAINSWEDEVKKYKVFLLFTFGYKKEKRFIKELREVYNNGCKIGENQ